MNQIWRAFLTSNDQLQTMNDYWNDPPEYEEIPECCEKEMEVDNSGNCKCTICGKIIKADQDPDPKSYE